MTALEQASELIKKHEGFSNTCYKCPAGFDTIGYGRLCDQKFKDSGLTRAEGEYLLANDLTKTDKELNKNFSWYEHLDVNRKAAMIDLAYNMGITRLLGFKKTLSLLAEKKYEKAAIELLDSKYAADVGRRAVTISNIIKTGNIL